MKSHYEILGLEPNANAEQIKKAYRKLSLKFHPDKNPDDEYFAAMFRQVNEAYQVLSDDLRRRAYDQSRQRSAQAEALAQELRNKERELNLREQQLRQRQANWQKSTVNDSHVQQPTYTKEPAVRVAKSQSEPAFTIKELKYTLYFIITGLVFLIALKPKVEHGGNDSSVRYGELEPTPHHKKHKKTKKHYQHVAVVKNTTSKVDEVAEKAEAGVTDTASIPAQTPTINSLPDSLNR